jgi:hypothetical protein
VGHREGDFDTGTHLSHIFFYATVVLLRLQGLDPEPPIGILAHPVQDREEWLVIWSGFHPQNTFDCHINTNFLDHDDHNILALFLGRAYPCFA